MIRVNLLASGAPSPRRALVPDISRAALAGVMLLLCTVGGLGYWWWSLGRQAVVVDARIAQSERDLVRLRDAAKLVDRAVARKTELSEKLALIERLRADQRGPVTMLSTISRSLSDGLWLMELNQRGNSIQLEGRASSLTSVTDFAERLQNSGVFDRPVEIVTTSMELVDELSVVRFALKAQAFGTTPPAAAAAPAQGRKGD